MAFIDKLLRTTQPNAKALSGGTTWPAWALDMARDERYTIPDYSLADNQLKAMQVVSWVAQAINAVANYVASSDLHVRRLQGEARSEIIDHPFEKLLENPNPDMSQAELLRATIASKKLTGSAYWWLNAAGPGLPPDEIWLVPSDRIRPVPDERMYIRGYAYRHANGEELLPTWQVVHMKNWHPRLPFAGLGDIEALAVTVEGDHKMNRWNLELFAEDNAKFPGVLAFRDMIADPQWQKIQADFQAENGGTRRRLRMLRGIGEGGVSWVQTLMTPHDIEFLEGRRFNREEIFGLMAPGLANMMAINATEANAVAGKKTLMDMAVWPQMVEIAAKITAAILPLYGDNLDCEFDDPRMPDRAMELAEQEAFAKVHTVDEVRARYYQDDPLGDERGKLLPAEITGRVMPSTEQPAPEEVTRQTNEPEPDEDMGAEKAARMHEQDELVTWRRYALKHGAQKARAFNCDHLPFGIETVVKARLAIAETDEEVKAAFSGPFLVKADRRTLSGIEDPLGRDKDRWERHLRRVLGDELADQLDEIMAALGDPPSLANIPPSFWDNASGRMIGKVRPELQMMALAAAEQMIAQGIGISWELAAGAAAVWATEHAGEMIRGVTEVSRQRVGRAVEQYFREPGRTTGDLVADLEPWFGATRAESIAVTEVTNAAAAGVVQAEEIARQAGYHLEPVWHTNRDELVCEICAPNDGKLRSEGWTVAAPAAHPRCRCWITERLVGDVGGRSRRR